MKHWLTKITVATFVLTVGGCGGWLGSKIQNKAYPLSMIERVLITPEVKPGEALLLAQHVDRKDQCDLVVKRVIRTSTGQRIPVRQAFEEDFGPIGGDKYILPVPTDKGAALGDAMMYSKAYSWCSWLDYIKPSEAEAWTVHFRFAENTRVDTVPDSFARIGTKHSTDRLARPNPIAPESRSVP